MFSRDVLILKFSSPFQELVVGGMNERWALYLFWRSHRRMIPGRQRVRCRDGARSDVRGRFHEWPMTRGLRLPVIFRDKTGMRFCVLGR